MICPFMSQIKAVGVSNLQDDNKQECLKEKCALWCELFMGDPKEGKKEGKCSIMWDTILTIENTQAVQQLIKIMEHKSNV